MKLQQQQITTRRSYDHDTYPLARFSYQNLSPSLMRRNWSEIIALKSCPGPIRVVSSKPPVQMSILLISFSWTSINRVKT